MNHLVKLQVIRVGECPGANITLVGAFLGVNSKFESKEFVSSLLISSVIDIPMMLRLCGAIGKRSWAVVALVRPVPRVGVHVSHQLLILNKASSANPAREIVLIKSEIIWSGGLSYSHSCGFTPEWNFMCSVRRAWVG